jgi:hypothetical protein
MISSRPNLYSESVIQQTAELVYNKFIKAYLKEAGEEDPDSDKDCIIKDLVKALWYDDGYRCARELSHCSWECDAELVEILEEAQISKLDIVDKLVKEWVIENNINPELEIGQKCSFTSQGKKYIGSIIKIEKNLGQYLIFCEALGHVKESDKPTKANYSCRTFGTYINYENVKACV